MLRSTYRSRDKIDGFNYRLSISVSKDCFTEFKTGTLVLVDDEMELGTRIGA